MTMRLRPSSLWTLLRVSIPRKAAAAVALLLLAGCSAFTPVKAPSFEEDPLPPLEWRAYRIQVDDVLEISFWGDSELDRSVSVRPDGMISLPYVDDVRAAGLTPAELDAELTRRYAAELRSPQLTVTIAGAGGQQIYVGGELNGAGSLHLTQNMTLAQAIQEAGGFSTSSRRKQVLVIRTLPNGERIARSVDMRPVFSGADPSRDIPLQGNDIIYVPRTRIANVNLWIEQYVNSIIPVDAFVTAAIFQSDLFEDDDNAAVADVVDDVLGDDDDDVTGDDPPDDGTDDPPDDGFPGGGGDGGETPNPGGGSR